MATVDNSTQLVVSTESGTGWSVDVTNANLDPDLTLKDFIVKFDDVIQGNADFTKTSVTIITYNGAALGSPTQVVISRDTPNDRIKFLTFGDRLQSAEYEAEFNRVHKLINDNTINALGDNSASIAALNARLDTIEPWVREVIADDTTLNVFINSAGDNSDGLSVATAFTDYDTGIAFFSNKYRVDGTFLINLEPSATFTTTVNNVSSDEFFGHGQVVIQTEGLPTSATWATLNVNGTIAGGSHQSRHLYRNMFFAGTSRILEKFDDLELRDIELTGDFIFQEMERLFLRNVTFSGGGQSSFVDCHIRVTQVGAINFTGNSSIRSEGGHVIVANGADFIGTVANDITRIEIIDAYVQLNPVFTLQATAATSYTTNPYMEILHSSVRRSTPGVATNITGTAIRYRSCTASVSSLAGTLTVPALVDVESTCIEFDGSDYDNTTSGLVATDKSAAIDEVVTLLGGSALVNQDITSGVDITVTPGVSNDRLFITPTANINLILLTAGAVTTTHFTFVNLDPGTFNIDIKIDLVGNPTILTLGGGITNINVGYTGTDYRFYG